MEPRPIMQRCTFCGQDWWDSHVCTPPKGTLEKLASMLPPAPPAPLPQGLRLPPSQLTEADVRRIVREELAAEKEENRRKLRAFIAEVHGADPDSIPSQGT